MSISAVQNKLQAAGEKGLGAPVYFPKGLPGMGEYKRYRLEPLKDNPFFYLLQSLQDPELGFILADPFIFFPGYRVQISDAELAELQAREEEELLVLTTVTVAGREKLTSNLAAPLLFNLSAGLGKQIIISDSMEEMRRPLELSAAAGKEETKEREEK